MRLRRTWTRYRKVNALAGFTETTTVLCSAEIRPVEQISGVCSTIDRKTAVVMSREPLSHMISSVSHALIKRVSNRPHPLPLLRLRLHPHAIHGDEHLLAVLSRQGHHEHERNTQARATPTFDGTLGVPWKRCR